MPEAGGHLGQRGRELLHLGWGGPAGVPRLAVAAARCQGGEAGGEQQQGVRQHFYSGGHGDGSQATEYSLATKTSAVHQHPTASSIGNPADKVHVIPSVRAFG